MRARPSNERRPDEQIPVDRYAGVDTEAGLLVYDTENETAWIESDTTRPLAETR